ncbi:ArsR family transcriptional regulator [Salinibacter ruber]|uniref:ArsR/SmtB family transcription factor n=1 Tax=Salinibacter ruber TaxID=146919 RepID=UPI002166D3BA|nr:metalloregulator ArsR/SmtB family transcription factor [Salinibacter ruber]MCS3669104.1 ArsR family transcriptional regulator [Salinibacter ruber]
MPAPADAAFTDADRRLAQAFKALGHPARVAIVRLLAERDECVCGEIVDDLPLAQSTVSQHLKALKEVGLIQGTIEGRRTCYCLNPEAMRALSEDTGDFFDALSLSQPPQHCC